jgi:hypothetical protein
MGFYFLNDGSQHVFRDTLSYVVSQLLQTEKSCFRLPKHGKQSIKMVRHKYGKFTTTSRTSRAGTLS